MNYFESMIDTLLEVEGYWTRSGHKVNLTQLEKRNTGKHSIPRPELDLLALSFKKNEVLVMEVKSYLDSPGVKLEDLQRAHSITQGPYKLFTSTTYREIVFGRLAADLIAGGMANARTKFRLGLAAGNVYRKRSDEIREHFDQQGWVFWSPEDIKIKMSALADRPYENNPAVMTAKVLLR